MGFIHKEGKSLVTGILVINLAIAIGILVTVGIGIAFYIIVGTLLIPFIAVAQFFRNPNRTITEPKDGVVYAPADGKVVVIEETTEDEYLNERRIQVSIFMSPLNVHVNRAPVSGEITYAKYHPGKFLVAWHPKSSTENERTSVVFKHKGVEIMVRQIAGAVARRIRYYVKAGDKVNQGQDYGFIKFGSRVDLFLPLDAKIDIAIGQTVKGNRTVIATL